MTQDNDVQTSGTIVDYIVQKLTNKETGEDFAIGFLKESFLTSAIQELFYARRTAHLTQEQVAQKLGKKQAAIARWEADFDGKLSLRQYVEIALACGMVPLPVQLEPIGAVREYLIDNPEVQQTHDNYESWWKKRTQSQPKEEVSMPLKTQAATEIAQFLAHHPTPEQIVAFHPSPDVTERAYKLIYTDRDGSLTEEEHKELDSYLVIEYIMELVKLEAHRQLRQQAS